MRPRAPPQRLQAGMLVVEVDRVIPNAIRGGGLVGKLPGRGDAERAQVPRSETAIDLSHSPPVYLTIGATFFRPSDVESENVPIHSGANDTSVARPVVHRIRSPAVKIGVRAPARMDPDTHLGRVGGAPDPAEAPSLGGKSHTPGARADS